MKVLVERSSWWLFFAVISIALLFVNVTAEETDLARTTGDCYYNYNHYGEGDRILTNEPCLNCTCHNKMLMCYLKVCPFTKPIGQDCTIEKREDQCCPIITCPEVPVELDQSLTQTTTDLATHQHYGCSIDGHFYPEGAQIPGNPKKPCELCYCIRNMTSCVMQECTLHVDGCRPIYNKGVCCPVRYDCAHEDEIPMIEDGQTTTEPPSQGFIITTTAIPSQSTDCLHNDLRYIDGELINTNQPCEHCYCMRGDIVCAVQDCGRPLEIHGKNCTARLPKDGECCPKIYECDSDAESTSTISFVTTLDYENVHTTTQKSAERFDDSGLTEKLNDQTTEKVDESENEIHDKDYDHVTAKPSRNKTAQQVPGSIDDPIENRESTTILNELEDAVASTLAGDSGIIGHGTPISTIDPIINKAQFVTEKTRGDDDQSADTTTESENIFTELYQLVVDYTTTLRPGQDKDESHDISSSADGSFLSNVIPGEGDCLDNGITYSNNTGVPSRRVCEKTCVCINSIVHCEEIGCTIPSNVEKCVAIYEENQCCPIYECDDSEPVPTESSKKDDDVKATTLLQKLDLPTEATMNTAGIAESTLHPFVHLPISSKFDNTLETKPDVSEFDDTLTEPEKEIIEPEINQQSPSPPLSEERTSPEFIHTEKIVTEAIDIEVTTLKSESQDIEYAKQPETPLETTVRTIESATANDSFEHHMANIAIEKLSEEHEFDSTTHAEIETGFSSQNDDISMMATKSPAIHSEIITTAKLQETEVTTLKNETIKHDDEQYTTQTYDEHHPAIESTETSEKLPIETIFEQTTTAKEPEIETIDATTARFGDEANKESSLGSIEKHDGNIMENEILELITQQFAQKEVTTEHRVESVPAVSPIHVLTPEQHETMVLMTQKNTQNVEKLPQTVEQDDKLQITSVASEIPSSTGEEILQFNHLVNYSQPIHEHTPPPVAVENDESITESFNQEMAPTHAPVELNPSTEFLGKGKPNENAESHNFESEHQTIFTTAYSAEPEATSVISLNIDSNNEDSNDSKDDDVIRPDEKEIIDFKEAVQPTERYEKNTDKSIEKPEKSNIVQEYKPEVTTIDVNKFGISTEVPFHSNDSIKEVTTSEPTNKYEDHVNSATTEAPGAGTTHVIPSKLEDLEIITDYIDASKQENWNIVTSTLAAEETTERNDISSESPTEIAQKIEKIQAATVSAVQSVSGKDTIEDLSVTQSIDFERKTTEIPTISNESGLEQSSTIQEQQPTTINIFSGKSTEQVELATETAQRIESPTTQASQQQLQEIQTQNQLDSNSDIQLPSNEPAVTTESAASTTTQEISNLNRTVDHEAEQEGFTTEKLNQKSTAQSELQLSNEAVEYDITTLLNKIHDDNFEITTLGNVRNEIATQKLDEATKGVLIQSVEEKTDRNIEHSTQHDENQSEEKISAEQTTTLAYDEKFTTNVPIKPQETSENIQSTEKIQEETYFSEKYTTSQSIAEEPNNYSSVHDPPVDAVTVHDELEVTKSKHESIDMIEIQTNRMPIGYESLETDGIITSVNPNTAAQESIETTEASNRKSEEPIIAHDEYPQEIHSQKTEVQTLTESTILETTTLKSIFELITTLHPVAQQQFESTTIESIEISSTEQAGPSTPILEKVELYISSTLQPNNAIDQDFNSEYSHNEENKTAEAVTVAPQSNVNVPSESTINIPLIRDPLPDRFDDITTKLAENFGTTTSPSMLFSHTYSDSTTVKNTQTEITEPSSHISEGPSPSQTDHEIESQPHAPTYTQPQAPSYDNSGYGNVPSQYPDEEYPEEEEPTVFGPGTCRYGGKLYVSAQQIPRDDSCDFCFCFRSDIICLQQSCPPPIVGCREEPISGFCCPRYECPVPMALVMNSTTTTTTTLPPYLAHFQRNSGKYTRSGCQVQGITYKIGERVTTASGPCIDCICGGDGQMKCDPKVCTPEPMLRQMIAVATKRR